LIKEFYCDGLGACLGNCPADALRIEEREAEEYDDGATIERIKRVSPEMLEVHMKHIKEHEQDLSKHFISKTSKEPCACPSAQTLHWESRSPSEGQSSISKVQSELHNWPIQLRLVNPAAPYLKNSNLLIAADCVPFSYANFHQEFLKGNSVVIGCPKLDDADAYVEKIAQIIKTANPKNIKIVHMEVPCCFELARIVQEAMKKAGKKASVEEITISIKGERLN